MPARDDEESGDNVESIDSEVSLRTRIERIERQADRVRVHLFGIHGRDGRLDRMEATMTALQTDLGKIKTRLDEQDKFAIKMATITATLVTIATVATNLVFRWL